jgi:hypothetical protein
VPLRFGQKGNPRPGKKGLLQFTVQRNQEPLPNIPAVYQPYQLSVLDSQHTSGRKIKLKKLMLSLVYHENNVEEKVNLSPEHAVEDYRVVRC